MDPRVQRPAGTPDNVIAVSWFWDLRLNVILNPRILAQT
jgi:hypothetical protein